MKLTEFITNLTIQLRASDIRAKGPYPPEVSEGEYLGILIDPDMMRRLIPLLEAVKGWSESEVADETLFNEEDAELMRAFRAFEE